MTEGDDLITAHRQVDERQSLEALATVQHEIWAHWMEYLFSQCQHTTGGITIPWDKASRWVRQINTPYEKLTEAEKESDREQARKVLGVIHE